MRSRFSTFAAAVSIAAAGVGIAAGAASAAPVALTEAVPVTDDGGTGTPGATTGSADLLPALLPLLTGSAAGGDTGTPE
ncbi:hypothetical protein [Nocardia sp. NPDC003963]